jgi:hypothetical protein
MKNTVVLLLSALVIAGSFSGCKKGENDPFLSLRSRKSRLEGNWVIVKEEVSETNINGSTTEIMQSVYDGKMKVTTTTTTVGALSTTVIDTVKYTVNFDIKKDGNYKIIAANENKIDIVTTEGTWLFLGKSKLNDLKNKEAILLTTTKQVVSSNPVANSVNYENLNGLTIVIDALKNKEMMTIVEENSSNEDGLTSSKKLTKTTYSHP